MNDESGFSLIAFELNFPQYVLASQRLRRLGGNPTRVDCHVHGSTHTFVRKTNSKDDHCAVDATSARRRERLAVGASPVFGADALREE